MHLIECQFECHGEAILRLLNEAIIHSTAIYEYQVRSMADMSQWFAAKQLGHFPVIGLEDDTGQLVAFASYGPFRAFPAFKYTVEHAIYVDSRFHGQGLGQRLLEQLIIRAQAQDKHTLIAAIDTSNIGSIALHKKLGFTCNGILPQVGFKFGRWLDLALYQKTLTTPNHPIAG